MRAFSVACVVCLMLAGRVGMVYPSDDAPVWGSASADRDSGDISGNPGQVAFKPSCTCCDIAYMDTFIGNRLMYAQTPEFLDAVRTVASGDSKYSPRACEEIPYARWKDFAVEMRRHSATHELDAAGVLPSAVSSDVGTEFNGLRALSDGKCMIPALIYLASLEYRLKSGGAGIKPIYPRLLRAAAAELNGRLAEKNRMAERFAQRAASIRSTIVKAERTIARGLPSDDLTRAKSELETAISSALGVRVSLNETDAAFSRAEQFARRLPTR